MNIPHIPVLLEEVKEAFAGIDEGYIVDCTLGYGGHSEALLEQSLHVKLIFGSSVLRCVRAKRVGCIL